MSWNLHRYAFDLINWIYWCMIPLQWLSIKNYINTNEALRW